MNHHEATHSADRNRDIHGTKITEKPQQFNKKDAAERSQEAQQKCFLTAAACARTLDEEAASFLTEATELTFTKRCLITKCQDLRHNGKEVLNRSPAMLENTTPKLTHTQ